MKHPQHPQPAPKKTRVLPPESESRKWLWEYARRRLQEVWSPMEGERDKDRALAKSDPGML